MDPITATTTIITLATFIKDLIDVGQSIKSSIDKVSENRRQIRDLTDDILCVLAEMAELSRQQAGQSQAPALLSALGDLKADMLYVLVACRKISPAQPSPGFRGFGYQIKVWMKRDDIEAKIRRLKEHVNKCYLKFTAFSAARIEETTTRIKETAHRTDNTTLRVEQSLMVNHVENQVKLQRLEGLMARMLLETQFGQDVMSRTIEIMATARLKDESHQTLEFKYLSAQTLRLVDLLQHSVAGRPLVLDTPLWDGTNLSFLRPTSPDHILYQILAVIFAIKESHAEIQFSLIEGILDLGSKLAFLGMNSEATAWEFMIIQILRRLPASGFQPAPETLPNLAISSDKLSLQYQHQLRWDLATEASQRAMDMCRLWQELSPDVEDWSLLGTILITHSENLRMTGRLEVAISIAEEAVAVFRGMAVQLVEAAAEVSCWGEPDDWKAVKFSAAFFARAVALASAERHVAAYEAAKEGFQTVLRTIFAPFLHHLHAYAYMSNKNHQISESAYLSGTQTLHRTPVLDSSRELKVHDCSAVIKDVIRARYFQPGFGLWIDCQINMGHYFSVFRTGSFRLSLAPKSGPGGNHDKIVGHLRTVPQLVLQARRHVWNFFYVLWKAGFLNDAIALCDEAVECLRCSPRDEDYSGIDFWLVRRTFILWDMGQIFPNSPVDGRRNWEAVKLLRDACGEVERAQGQISIHLRILTILPADLAAARRLKDSSGRLLRTQN
ncbi:hypothetical protein DFH09DRAFT_1291385, partial [Mycena vulgaris]